MTGRALIRNHEEPGEVNVMKKPQSQTISWIVWPKK
jgi:hypothetical protein